MDPYTIIQSFVAAHWATTPVRWPNTAFTRPAETIWLDIELESGVFRQESIGAGDRRADLWREEGELIANVMIPPGTGIAEGRAIGRAFADLFRGLDIDTLTFGAAQIGNGAQEPDGADYVLPVSIFWTRDE